MTKAFNELGRLTMKGVRQIHGRGVDAFVVFLGNIPSAAFDKQAEAQDRARGLVGEGWKREQVRIKRIRV